MNIPRLLHIYHQGFNDSLKGCFDNFYKDELDFKAYELGDLHARLGDDVRSFDYLSDSEILNEIINER